VVPGTTHLVPLIAPVVHTNETMASSSAQRAVFSGPLTMRKPCMDPVLPSGPEARGDLADPISLAVPHPVAPDPVMKFSPGCRDRL
jgi:hypothetical protein